jgi:hypothetical protein
MMNQSGLYPTIVSNAAAEEARAEKAKTDAHPEHVRKMELMLNSDNCALLTIAQVLKDCKAKPRDFAAVYDQLL